MIRYLPKFGLMFFLVGVAMFFLTAFAHADQVRIRWVHPTTNDDGSALNTTEITQTRIEVGTCIGYNDFGDLVSEKVRLGTANSVMIYNLTAGETYCFRGYTTTTSESVASNVISITMPRNISPNPPTLSF